MINVSVICILLLKLISKQNIWITSDYVGFDFKMSLTKD